MSESFVRDGASHYSETPLVLTLGVLHSAVQLIGSGRAGDAIAANDLIMPVLKTKPLKVHPMESCASVREYRSLHQREHLT